jgi:hypothetical protein
MKMLREIPDDPIASNVLSFVIKQGIDLKNKGEGRSVLHSMVDGYYLQHVGLVSSLQGRLEGENSTCLFTCLVALSSIFANWSFLQCGVVA